MVPGTSETRDSFLAKQPVGERGLADVGPADDGDGELRWHVGGFLVLRHREERLQGLPQLADSAAVLCREHDRWEAQATEVGVAEVGVAAVGLVDGEHHRRASAADRLGDVAVGRDDALHAVDHEHDRVGVGNGAQCLVADHARDLCLGVGLEAASVDEDDAAAGRARRVRGDAVAGDPWQVVGERPPPACQPVEQRGLAHVGASHDRHGRRHSARLRRPRS